MPFCEQPPYVFISYSHKDIQQLQKITGFFDAKGIKYWYDTGIESGSNFHQSIALHLNAASSTVLLLTPNAAASEYVKNELHFALAHKIPLHILCDRSYTMPIDIEIMIGTRQLLYWDGNYQAKLLSQLPHSTKAAPAVKKPVPSDPRPCGSEKKYKDCHGKPSLWVCNICGKVQKGIDPQPCPICRSKRIKKLTPDQDPIFSVWECSSCKNLEESAAPLKTCPICHSSSVKNIRPATQAYRIPPAGKKPASSQWVCSICGYKQEGVTPPEKCPVCKMTVFVKH